MAGEHAAADWRHRAACVDEDPELFFPIGNTGPAAEQIAEAKAVCRGCPVSRLCLSWALGTGQDAGDWGGLAEDERCASRHQRRRQGSGHRSGGGASTATSVAVPVLVQVVTAAGGRCQCATPAWHGQVGSAHTGGRAGGWWPRPRSRRCRPRRRGGLRG